MCSLWNSIFVSIKDGVVEAIFNEDFGLSDGDNSDFEGDNDICALLGETVLQCKDVMGDYMDEESISEAGSEGEVDDAIEMPEASAVIEDEHKGLLALVCWVTHIEQMLVLKRWKFS